jgi:hypothetical protein
MSRDEQQIGPATRSRAAAKASYDRLSRWYDLIAAGSERRMWGLPVSVALATGTMSLGSSASDPEP